MSRTPAKSHSLRRLLVVCVAIAIPLTIGIAYWTKPNLVSEDPQAVDLGELKAVLASRRQLDHSLWADEQLALEFENAFIRLWDELRADEDVHEAVARFPFTSIAFGQLTAKPSLLPHTDAYTVDRAVEQLPAEVFLQMVVDWQNNGYVLEQSEWHHEKLELREDNRYVSTIQATLHIASHVTQQRMQFAGPLLVTWSNQKLQGFHVPDQIDASGLVGLASNGPQTFLPHFTLPLEAIQSEATYNDVLAADLDQNGLVDIIYPRSNLLLRNSGGKEFIQERLFVEALPGICEGLLVDYTGNRRADFLCAAINATGTSRDVFVYEADAQGQFTKPPRRLTDSLPDMVSPDSFTAGDIDRDGDLDLYVTQYYAPYRDGKMPSPYYDANDGLPSYLLLNDGTGRLEDVTEDRGLAAKRHRRTYRSSFVDLDGDRDLDLLVTSDFSGVDLYQNDGSGVFQDVTPAWLSERSLFGMSHVVADFDDDGLLDIYATGMSSTTARRLESLGLARPDFPRNRVWRTKLAYGNRLFYRGDNNQYRENSLSADVARAGWSWGCAAFDVENDGDVDLYVANGHLSGKSAADYCTRFWCHDIYVEHSAAPGFMELVKRNTVQLGTSVSWNGYEKNRLYLNRGSSGFVDAAYLSGVAIEEDSRSVLAEDFDGDGRVDLLIGFADRTKQPPRYVLRGFLNRRQTDNHWIGVRLAGSFGAAAVGAQIEVHTDRGVKVDTMITGESFACQPSPSAHFGLGASSTVTQIVVHWVDGRTTTLESPAIDRYHDISANAAH